MGLPLDKPGDFLLEAQDAVRGRKKHTDFSLQLKKLAAGSKYRSDWKPPIEVHENHAQEWVANMVPNLVGGLKVSLRSTSMPTDDPRLKKLEVVLNCWGQGSDLKQLLIQHAYDMQYDFPVALVSTEEIQAYAAGQETPVWAEAGKPSHFKPKTFRIPPQMFFRDLQTINRLGGRFVGHMWVEDKESLLSEKLPNGRPKYDREALEAAGIDNDIRGLLSEMGITCPGSGIDREQVVGYEVYVPETGMIYTMANTVSGGKNGGKYLCEPRRYRGPASGPYAMGGVTLIPDQVYPLPPLALIHDLMLELNRHAGQASDDAGAMKSLTVVDADPKSVGKIMMAGNRGFLALPGFKGSSQEVRFGGASPDQLAYIEILNARIDKTLGLSEAIRGNSTGDTAEEVRTIQQNRNLRVRWAQERFADFAASIYRIAATHFVTNPRAYQDVHYVDDITGDTYSGAYDDGELARSGLRMEDLHLEIDVNTMGPQNDALRSMNMMKGMEWAGANAQVMVANPHLQWEKIAEDFYDSLGFKGRGKRYVNFEILKAMQSPIVLQAMMAQAQLQAVMSGQPPMGAPGEAGPPQMGGAQGAGQNPQAGGGGPPQLSPPNPVRQGASQNGAALRIAQ